MAKALQCPECGERHPLADLAGTKTFRCRSCGRLLKVPAEAAAVAAGAPSRTPDPAATAAVPKASAGARVPPSQRGVPLRETSAPAPVRPVGRVPRSMRVLVWLTALPLGLVPVAAVGRAAGLLSVDAAVDVFIGIGYGRFLPIALALPVWALITATIAHLILEALARRSGGRADPVTNGQR